MVVKQKVPTLFKRKRVHKKNNIMYVNNYSKNEKYSNIVCEFFCERQMDENNELFIHFFFMVIYLVYNIIK